MVNNSYNPSSELAKAKQEVKKLTTLLAKQQKSFQLQIHRTRNYYENILALMPGHVYWLDTNNIFLGCNNLQAQSANLSSREEIIGKTNFYLPWKEQAMQINAVNQRVFETGIATTEIETAAINGEKRIYLSQKMPLHNDKGTIIGLLGISLDITDLKKMEAELIKAKEGAEQANRAKLEFIANMSHDLRTPLTGIIGISQILANKVKTPGGKDDVRMLQESGQRLLLMCNDILESISAENINESSFNPTSFDLAQEILDLYRLEKPTLKSKKLSFHILLNSGIPQFIQTDRTKLQRILLNLLGNAIKFTDQGGITLTIKIHKNQNTFTTLEFIIKDTGIGIPDKLLNRIFDRFYRVTPSYKGGNNGQGIGLAIVKQYVNLLGGIVYVKSNPGVGSSFSFTIPVQIDTNQEKNNYLNTTSFYQELAELINPSYYPDESTSVQNHQLNSPHLLLIEDDATALYFLKTIVEQAGCRATAVKSGEEGFNLAIHNHFDLIITDIGLPGISGTEMAKQLRANEKFHEQRPVPIIALTGHGVETAKKECFQAGISHIVTKPLNSECLQELLSLFTRHGIESLDNTILTQDDSPAKEINSINLEKHPLLNFKLALEQMGGSLNLVRSTLEAMVQTTPEDITSLEVAYARRDWEKIKKLAHKIKSGAIYCCAPRLRYACQILEDYFSGEQTKHIDNLYKQFLQIVQDTLHTIHDWLKQN